MRFGLFPFRSPLLRESRLLSLPAGTEMFHFPALPPAALCIQAGATPHDGGRVSPFGNPRITAWLPAPRGLSQAPTSFFGSWYQGIHRVPLKTWLHICTTNTQRNPPPSEKGHPRRDIGSSRYIDARVHCAVLKKRTAPQPPSRIRGRRPQPVLKTRDKPVSSGPNSVPTRNPSRLPRSAPQGDVLAGRKKQDPGE
jgi:hypothetical protein